MRRLPITLRYQPRRAVHCTTDGYVQAVGKRVGQCWYLGANTVRSFFPGLLEAIVPMFCYVLSVLIGIVFGLQETSTNETSVKLGAPPCGVHQAYASALMQDVMGYSFFFGKWCDTETSKILLHTESYSWIPSLALLLGCFIAICQIILSETREN